MAISKLSGTLYIAPQLTRADVQQAVALGIRTVVCHRPDAEEAGHPPAAEVRQWLAEAGISHFYHQPVSAPSISTADAAEFQALLAQAEAPVLAYCRTGTRSSLLWGLHQVQHGTAVAAVKTAAAQADVDLTPFETRLQQAAAV